MIDASRYSRTEYVFRFFLLLEWGEDRSQEIEDLSLEEVKEELEKTLPQRYREMSYSDLRLEMDRRLRSNNRKNLSRWGGGVKKRASARNI